MFYLAVPCACIETSMLVLSSVSEIYTLSHDSSSMFWGFTFRSVSLAFVRDEDVTAA